MRAKWGPWLLFAASAVAAAAALIIGHNRYGPGGRYSLSQANGLCASAFGQVAQVTSARASANCALVATAEQARGWLLIGGVAGMCAAYAWHTWVRRQGALSRPAAG